MPSMPVKRAYIDVTDESIDALIESLRAKSDYEKFGIRMAPESGMSEASFIKLAEYLATDRRMSYLWLQAHNSFLNPRKLADAEARAFEQFLRRNDRVHTLEFGS